MVDSLIGHEVVSNASPEDRKHNSPEIRCVFIFSDVPLFTDYRYTHKCLSLAYRKCEVRSREKPQLMNKEKRHYGRNEKELGIKDMEMIWAYWISHDGWLFADSRWKHFGWWRAQITYGKLEKEQRLGTLPWGEFILLLCALGYTTPVYWLSDNWFIFFEHLVPGPAKTSSESMVITNVQDQTLCIVMTIDVSIRRQSEPLSSHLEDKW